MFLIWDTVGGGYLSTPDGVVGVTKQEYNLFYRMINSDQLPTPFATEVKTYVPAARVGKPQTFNKAELDIMRNVLNKIKK